MSPYCYCKDCACANPHRKIDEMIRCTHFSVWVDPMRIACPEFLYKKEVAE